VRRSLAPYAIGAALVFVVSVAVLAGALAAGGLLEERIAAPDASPTASASRAPVELSRAGRIAYWRTDPAGGTQLWVSNVDGSGRRAIAKTDSVAGLSNTRWSPDGESIGYLDRGGQSVAIQRLDGAHVDLPLPPALVTSGSRFIDLDWSTDSGSVAATQRDAGSQTTDVYVALASGGAWRNVTLLRNAFLSQWISADELLVQTGNGLIGVQRVDGTRLRPLTAQVATSPFLSDDGRVYYFAGQVSPAVRDATVPVINAGQARVWSLTLDGGDIRQETATQAYDDVRLVARWPNGRFVVHQGASTALAFLADGQPPIDTTLGVVDRVVFSPDRRTAIGLTGSRIFRYDTAQPSTPVVLLSDVAQPDAWYPETVTIAHASPAPTQARPSARYAFSLGGLIWATDASGGVLLLRQQQANDLDMRRLSGVAIPQWSPAGDRIVYFDVLASSFRGAVFVTDVTGTGGRLSDQDAVGPFPTWSPDGNVAYTDLLASFDSAGFGGDGEIRIVTPTNGARVATYRGREIAFGGGKTFLIDNGKLDLPYQIHADHSILESTPTGTRTVATAAGLSSGTQLGAAQALQLSMLGSSADGAFLSVRVSPDTGSLGFIFAIVRAADGRPTLQADAQAVADIRWSPTGHLTGMTLANIPVVRDAETGSIVASAGSGRFAGWSPDGKWFYVARETGLYAQRLSGGDPVRISPLGVPVSTTTP
jgi:Tol biopolymer transport system component